MPMVTVTTHYRNNIIMTNTTNENTDEDVCTELKLDSCDSRSCTFDSLKGQEKHIQAKFSEV